LSLKSANFLQTLCFAAIRASKNDVYLSALPFFAVRRTCISL